MTKDHSEVHTEIYRNLGTMSHYYQIVLPQRPNSFETIYQSWFLTQQRFLLPAQFLKLYFKYFIVCSIMEKC